jgi:hypothetical protein
MMSYLYNWANSPDFVELWIILYADGTFATYQNPAATWNSTGATTFSIINGNLYLPAVEYSSNIISIGHTHTLHQYPTPPDANGDNDYFQVPSGVSRFIYYDWRFYYY